MEIAPSPATDRVRATPLDINDGQGGVAGGATDDVVTFDIARAWSAIYRNRWLIVVIMATAVAAGLAFTALSRPIYRATASIQIDMQAARVLESDDEAARGSTANEDRFLQTQLDVLRSRTLAERVVDAERLSADNRFLLAMGVRPSALPDGATARRKATISLVRDGLIADIPRDTRVASLSFDSPDPALSARIANSYARNYIVQNLQRRYDASAYAREFLQGQIARAKQQLERSDRESLAYARATRLIDTGNQNGGDAQGQNNAGLRSLVVSSLVQINNALTAAQAERIEAAARWRGAATTPLLSLPEVLSNSAIQALVQQRAELQSQMAEQGERRRADYPEMRQAAARITSLSTQIDRLANNVRESIRQRYVSVQQQEASLRADRARLESATLGEQERSVRYNILRRDVDTNRSAYDALLQRYREVSASAGITNNNVSMVDEATTPGAPIKPRPALNLLLAVLAGLVVTSIVLVLRETFDDAVRSPQDVEEKLGESFLGAVPVLPEGVTPKEAFQNIRSDFSEAYLSIRSLLQFATATGLPRTMLVTSTLPGEGKTTTSSTLARFLARTDKRVLLIDADMRKPSLHRQFEVPLEPGFSNLLLDDHDAATLAKAIRSTDVENLSLVTSGTLPPNPGELLSKVNITASLERIGKHFDVIVLDGPPVMGFADAPLLAAITDCTIFVSEASLAHRGQAKTALRRLRTSGAHLFGVVLTKFDPQRLGYGYGYGYSYNYDYGMERESRRKKFLDFFRKA